MILSGEKMHVRQLVFLIIKQYSDEYHLCIYTVLAKLLCQPDQCCPALQSRFRQMPE